MKKMGDLMKAIALLIKDKNSFKKVEKIRFLRVTSRKILSI